ncbi:MAG TPA: hypothetical protein V6C58_22965, partial [Allocoleopsis sp.]
LDDKKYKIVTDKFVSEGGCVNDTIFSSDTTVVFDSLYILDFKTDTMYIDDIKTILKTEYKTITKTVTIKDTAVVTDRTKEELLNSKIAHQFRKIKELEQQIKDEQLNTKEQRQRSNKWRFYFWALIVAAGIYIFRKPLFKLITKIPI